MFSTAQMALIEPLVQSMHEQGYPYYLVYTKTNLDSYNDYNTPDLVFYFSKSEMTCDGYTFASSGDVVCMEYVTRNVSNSTTDNKVERCQKQGLSSMGIYVNPYEHIFTNAEGAMYGNVLAEMEYTKQNDVGFNLDLNHYYVGCVLICIVILLMWLKTWFARGVGDGAKM